MAADTNNPTPPVPPATPVPPPAPPTPVASVPPIRFKIEFATPENGNTQCQITRREYRGRFAMDSISLKGRLPDDRFMNMPDLPGHTLEVDSSHRTVDFRDPLEDPENREILRDAKATYAALGWGNPEPDEAIRHGPNLPVEVFKLWVYWCRRWLDSRQVVVLSGQVPPMEAILKMPGEMEFHLMTENQEMERKGYEYGKGKLRPYQPPKHPKGRRARK